MANDWFVFDDFEDNDLAEWSSVSADATTDTKSYSGSYSAYVSDTNSDSEYLKMERGFSGDIKQVKIRYWEEDYSQGAGYQFMDSSGNRVAGVGTANPEWIYTDGTSGYNLYTGSNYHDWHEIKLTFDYANGNYDIRWENLATGTVKTTTASLDTNNPVVKIKHVNVADASALGSQYISSDGDSGITHWTDKIEADLVDTVPSAPTNASITVNANDSIDFSFTDNSSGSAGGEDNWRIEISRDGSTYQAPTGSSGPHTPAGDSNSGDTHTYNYTPDSDYDYYGQVGIDSSFQFRVRAENSAGSSSWAYSSTKYTEPVPPHKVSVSRPNANTIRIHATKQSDVSDYIKVHYREDTGSGYSSWKGFDAISGGEAHVVSGSWSTKGDTIVVEYKADTNYQDNRTFTTDSRTQWRIRDSVISNNQSAYAQTSHWVYADYGNKGNVYFTDDFEDGDLAEWTDEGSGDATPTVTNNTSDQGSYSAKILGGGDEYIQRDLGDLSAEYNVLVKAALRHDSLDTSSEYNYVKWYDGSAWQTVGTYGWEYNDQGWHEAHFLIPNSYLSTDNRLRFQCHGGGDGDNLWVDRVVVSDVLHEYTTPTAPSNLEVDTTTENQYTASWTNNHNFTTETDGSDINTILDYKKTSSSTWNHDYASSTTTTITHSGLPDGEAYDLKPGVEYIQVRNGSRGSWFRVFGGAKTAVTKAPLPSSFSLDGSVSGNSISSSWTESHDNEDAWRGYIRKNTSETGLKLDASGDDITLSNKSFRNAWNNENGTFLFRLRIDQINNTNKWVDIIDFGSTGSGDLRLERESNTNDQLRFHGGASGTADAMATNLGSYSTGKPFSVALVLDGTNTETRGYFNGNLQDTRSNSGLASMNLQNLIIRRGFANWVAMELAVYNRKLSGSEIQSFHDGNLPSNGLTGYWPFDHNATGTSYDESPQFHNASVNGPTLVGPTRQDNSGALAANTTGYTFTGIPSANEYEVFVASETEHGRTRSPTSSIVKVADDVPQTSGGVWKTDSSGVVDTSWYRN